MKPSPSKSPETNAELDQVIDEATTRIHTQTLSDRGVQKLRILSQSRFLHMVEDLVERTLEQKVGEVRRALLAEGVGNEPGPSLATVESAETDADVNPGAPERDASSHRALVLPPPGSPSLLSEARGGTAVTRAPLRTALESIRREIETHYESAWKRLRAEQTEQLVTLEERLAGLSGSLGEMVGAVTALETRQAEAASARHEVPRFLRRRLEQGAICDAD